MESRILANNICSILALLMLLLALGAFSSTAFAQGDPGYYGGEDEVIDRGTGKLKAKQSPSLPDQIQLASRRSTALIEVLQSEVVAYFTDWAERMAQVLAGAILLFSFLRIWRENNGQGANLFWWFARLAVCLGLIGSGPWLINWMYDMGRDIAMEASANSVVYRFYDRNQTNFTESYAKIALGTFTVKVNGTEFAVPSVDGYRLGVIYDQSSTIRDFNNHLKDTTYILPKLFAWLGACRAILEGGDFWLAILSGVLIMAFKILAPFMIVVGIDSKLAQRVSYPFLWGVIVLTLIWPTVSYFLRGLAYLFGNVAMAMGDVDPVYAWNEATWQAFRGAASQPLYTVLFACFAMTITALCLWISPVIAYQISMGRVYEGVSNAASSFAGMVIGTAMEWYTANAGAKLNQEAAAIQAGAGFESEATRAGAERRAADLGAKARQTTSLGQAKGGLINQQAQIESTKRYQQGVAGAGQTMGNNSAKAGADLAKADMGVRTKQQIKELEVGKDQQAKGIEVDRAADTDRWKGEKAMMGSAYAGYRMREYAKGMEDEAKEAARGKGSENSEGGDSSKGGESNEGWVSPGTVRGVGTAIEIGGSAYGMYKQYGAIQDRAAGQTDALNKATDQRIQIQNEAQAGYAQNQDAYQQKMVDNNRQFAGDQVKAATESAAIASGGASRNYNIQVGAINKGTQLELQANQARYDGQMKAAEITRSGAVDAARLHAMERVFTAVSNKIARDIEKGIELRY